MAKVREPRNPAELEQLLADRLGGLRVVSTRRADASAGGTFRAVSASGGAAGMRDQLGESGGFCSNSTI